MFRELLKIKTGRSYIEGELIVPEASGSLVIFSHGSGSSRFSPRNNFIAGLLHKENISTFLPDLLTAEEDQDYENRFNITLLTSRLMQVTRMVQAQEKVKAFKCGYFGASTGAASALKASVELGDAIQAIVSRGGRPDLVPEVFSMVTAPTLLIVGERDEDVLALNQEVAAQLSCIKKLVVVKNATHLFEEPGTLEQAGQFAVEWFKTYLSS